MAILDFDIEYTLRSSIRITIPDSLKELDENQIRRLIIDISKSIVKNIDKDDADIVRGGIKLISKPKFIEIENNNTMLGLNRLPDLSLSVKKFCEPFTSTKIDGREYNENSEN